MLLHLGQMLQLFPYSLSSGFILHLSLSFFCPHRDFINHFFYCTAIVSLAFSGRWQDFFLLPLAIFLSVCILGCGGWLDGPYERGGEGRGGGMAVEQLQMCVCMCVVCVWCEVVRLR